MAYAFITVLVPVAEGVLVPAEVVSGLPASARFTSSVLDGDAMGVDSLKILADIGRQAGIEQARVIANRGWPEARDGA